MEWISYINKSVFIMKSMVSSTAAQQPSPIHGKVAHNTGKAAMPWSSIVGNNVRCNISLMPVGLRYLYRSSRAKKKAKVLEIRRLDESTFRIFSYLE